MAPTKLARTPLPGRLIGYACVSTEDQGTDPQRDELRTAGWGKVFEERASGADRNRPVLARLLQEIRLGKTLVVVRLDRLARSVTHLLTVIELLDDRWRPLPEPARSDRYQHTAGYVLSAGPRRRRST